MLENYDLTIVTIINELAPSDLIKNTPRTFGTGRQIDYITFCALSCSFTLALQSVLWIVKLCTICVSSFKGSIIHVYNSRTTEGDSRLVLSVATSNLLLL